MIGSKRDFFLHIFNFNVREKNGISTEKNIEKSVTVYYMMTFCCSFVVWDLNACGVCPYWDEVTVKVAVKNEEMISCNSLLYRVSNVVFIFLPQSTQQTPAQCHTCSQTTQVNTHLVYIVINTHRCSFIMASLLTLNWIYIYLTSMFT